MPRAVVVTAGWSFGAYDLLRSLGRERIPCVVASSQRDDVAIYSRYCTQHIQLPEFEKKSYDEIAAILLEFSAKERLRPVLFYASDPELDFVARYRDVLGPAFQLNLPESRILDALANKVEFSRLAMKFDLPVPQTLIFKDAADVESQLSAIRFPCIVKPAYSHDWVWESDQQREFFGPYKKALRRFDSADTLVRFCRLLPQRRTGFLIQQYIEGRDEGIASFHGYFDEQSECLAYFVGEKVRTYPAHTGGSVYIRTVLNPELALRSIDYLQRIDFRGIVKVDFKRDPQSGEFHILEVNARYNLWELLGAYAGMNLAAIAYRHQVGFAQATPQRYSNDERLLFFKQDFRAFITGYRKSGEWSVAAYIRSLARRLHFRVFDVKDPAPFLVSSLDFLKRNVLKSAAALSGVFSRRRTEQERGWHDARSHHKVLRAK